MSGDETPRTRRAARAAAGRRAAEVGDRATGAADRQIVPELPARRGTADVGIARGTEFAPAPPMTDIDGTPARRGSSRLSRAMEDALGRGRLRTLLVAAGCLIGVPSVAGLAAGWAVLVAGAALHLWARGCLRVNQELTTSGPYRWVRNPFYLGNLLIDLGICVAIGRPWLTAAYAVLWFVAYRRTILREERRLRRLFGAPFDQYRGAVPMLFPLRGAARGLPDSSPFSWTNPRIAEGRELARLLRAAAAPLLVFIVRSIVQRRPALDDPVVTVAVPFFVALWSLERAMLRSVKRRRRLVPDAFHRVPVRAAAVAACLAVAVTTEFLEWDRDLIVRSAGAAIVGAVLVVLLVAPRRTRSEPALLRTLEGAACLAGCVVAEEVWLGLAAFTWFCVLAIDARGAAAAPAPARPLRFERLGVAALALVFVAAAIVKESMEGR